MKVERYASYQQENLTDSCVCMYKLSHTCTHLNISHTQQEMVTSGIIQEELEVAEGGELVSEGGGW